MSRAQTPRPFLAPDVTPEDLAVFQQEADELLSVLDERLIDLENASRDSEAIQEVFRAAHTLKGSSATLGYRAMAEVAHAMEGLLDLVRQGVMASDRAAVDALLEGLDALRLLHADLDDEKEAPSDTDAVVASLRAVARRDVDGPPRTESAAGEPRSAAGLIEDQAVQDRVRAALAAGETVFLVSLDIAGEPEWRGIRGFQALHELGAMGELIASSPSASEMETAEIGPRLDAVLGTAHAESAVAGALSALPDVEAVRLTPYAPPSSSDEAQAQQSAAPAQERENGRAATPDAGRDRRTLRIDVERVDALMNLIGELAIERTRIVQCVKTIEERYRGDESSQSLSAATAQLVRVVNDLQDGVMRVRMLPVGTAFNGLTRLVRDLARKSGKEVQLIIAGEDTEVDRSVIEHIRDPLVHLIRNCVDHGIEPPDRRRASGKPEAGTIRITASQQQAHIVIAVEDDGGGIDVRKVKEKAVARGAVSPEAAARMSDAEAVNLIFAPGLSTADQVSEVSGRGVGMDVVRTNIEAINGLVAVETRLGQGTLMTLSLPLTLATVDGLLVCAAGDTYVIPLAYVSEVVKLQPEMVMSIGLREVINLRGAVVPLLRLSAVFGLEPEAAESGLHAVIVRVGDRPVGLVVDSVREPQEIVVKSLGPYVGDVRGLAGSSVLADGHVVLILDVLTLVHSSSGAAVGAVR